MICKSGNLLKMLVNCFRRKREIHPEMSLFLVSALRKGQAFLFAGKALDEAAPKNKLTGKAVEIIDSHTRFGQNSQRWITDR
ncbi:hypothetical protein MUB23_03170 [Cuneatibacter sp. NSJ-177]|uniref:hypothetical protein n=1 Tax=Cuneatibacter sp. NSJ-177 TaxID=2931401 RepID=UPI001FD4A012|nr:hypothetical protein [Cuneatibacter sp. NSJ-177]MCJ7834398.1 hypothetical protein [Cuneatibacter sp. NSJ-177]